MPQAGSSEHVLPLSSLKQPFHFDSSWTVLGSGGLAAWKVTAEPLGSTWPRSSINTGSLGSHTHPLLTRLQIHAYLMPEIQGKKKQASQGSVFRASCCFKKKKKSESTWLGLVLWLTLVLICYCVFISTISCA